MRKRALVLAAGLALVLGAAAPGYAHPGHTSCADFGLVGTAAVAQVSPGNLAGLIATVKADPGVAAVVGLEHGVFCGPK